MSDEQIKQAWRKLGFFCEMDTMKRQWRVTGSRAGLLYFPDLLLGFINDPKNATDGEPEHYGPYGSLVIMMWPDAGFDSHAIRGSTATLAHLAELIEVKLATAEPGQPIMIREEYAADSPYSLMLDVRADGFDPAAAGCAFKTAIQTRPMTASAPTNPAPLRNLIFIPTTTREAAIS